MAMTCLSIRQKKRIFFLFCLLFITSFTIACAIAPALADVSEADFHKETAKARGIIQTLALTGGAIGIGWCGIEFVYGSAEAAQKAKGKAIMIAAATAALFALPYIISAGKSFASQHRWDPSSLK